MERVAVQEVDEPEATDDGEQTNEDKVAGAISIKVALAEESFSVAVIWAVASVVIAATVEVKVAELAPAAMETEAGTVTEGFPLASATGSPPLGAVLDKVAVQELDEPEATDEGEQVSEDTLAGATKVKVEEMETPSDDAVIWAVVSAVIAPAAAANVALVDPAVTMAEEGTVTSGLLLARAIEAPPVPAGIVRVTVHEVATPGPSTAGLQPNAARLGEGEGGVISTVPSVAVNAIGVPKGEEAAGWVT